MRRGDVVIAVLPGELGKARPAVIVQGNELGDATTTILVCPLSSSVQEIKRLRPLFEPPASSGLRVRSQAMADKITPLRRDRIRGQIGVLDQEEADRLDQALLVVLGLSR